MNPGIGRIVPLVLTTRNEQILRGNGVYESV